MVFGRETYAIFGRDKCPITHDAGCVVVEPGVTKNVILNPIGTSTRLNGAIYFTQAHGATTMVLSAVSYPDGRALNFSPPLVGLHP